MKPIPAHINGLSLFNLPTSTTSSQIKAKCTSLFELTESVHFTRKQYLLYWPFVSNFWISRGQNKSKYSPSYITEYFDCRFFMRKKYGKPVPAEKGSGSRVSIKSSKWKRDGLMCKARITVTHNKDEVIIARLSECEYDHSLDESDARKRNDHVRDIIWCEACKGYSAAAIRDMIKGVWQPDGIYHTCEAICGD